MITFTLLTFRQSVLWPRYCLNDAGFEFRRPGGGRFFSSPKRPDRLWGPPSLIFSGYRGISSGVKRPECDVDHSPPSSAEVKNEWRCNCSVLICFDGIHRDSCTFLKEFLSVQHLYVCCNCAFSHSSFFLSCFSSFSVVFLVPSVPFAAHDGTVLACTVQPRIVAAACPHVLCLTVGRPSQQLIAMHASDLRRQFVPDLMTVLRMRADVQFCVRVTTPSAFQTKYRHWYDGRCCELRAI